MDSAISDVRLNALKNEILMSRAFTKQVILPQMQEAIGRYVGSYVPDTIEDFEIILNEIYPIIQFHLPSIFFQNPRAFLKPRNETYLVKKRDPITKKMVEVTVDSQKSAKTQEHILNYMVSQIGYKEELRKVLMDALMSYFGVLWHGYKGDFGMTEEQSIIIKDERVFVQRISPLRFLKDPSVSYSDIDKGQWVGREIDLRYEDFIEDDSFNIEKDKVKGFKGFGEMVSAPNNLDSNYRAPILEFAEEEFKKSSSSRFVRLQEIFYRPTRKEKREGKKGKIIVLAIDEQETPLRVNDWDIDAEGFPAHVLELNAVNDRMIGLPDIDTYKSIADQKNIISNLQIRNAKESTKVWVAINKNNANEEDVTKIQNGENTIILFDGDTPVGQRMMVSSPGGQASSELYLIDQRIQRNLEDKSGVSDLKRGFSNSGEESATSIRQRSAGGAARPSYRRDLMADFIKKSFLYLNQLNKQFMTIKDAVRVVGSLDLEWSDKPTREEIQADVDVEIDMVSMVPEDPERELKEFQVALGLAIDAITNPAINLKLKEEGKTVEISPLIEQILLRLKIRNPNVFRAIKQQESQGFVSVSELRQARDNVTAALSGAPIPYPPTEQDDHRAKLETYTTIQALVEAAGQVSDTLNQLIEVHQRILQEIESKEASSNQKIDINSLKAANSVAV